MKDYITDDRGQVGIGTLIVFIALVLVAAIAAGVLINTAGFLQTQAEETGTDSTDQVADNINVIGEVGEVLDPANGGSLNNPAVGEIRLTVQRSPGSEDIDLTGLSIQYVGEDGFGNLVHVSQQEGSTSGEFDGGDGENVYLIEAITADTESDAVMTSDSDRYEIVIPTGVYYNNADDQLYQSSSTSNVLNDGSGSFNADYTDRDVEMTINDNFDNSGLDLLGEGDRVELEITTDSGSQRNVALSVPDSLIGDEGSSVTL